MAHPNLELITKFFEAYARHDLEGIRKVMAADVEWTFPGRHPLSGKREGTEQVVAFFDAVGGVMGRSNVRARQLVMGVNDGYVVEAQHVQTDRTDGNNLDVDWCVLWRFAGGKIIEGKHLASDQYAVDEFFNTVLPKGA